MSVTKKPDLTDPVLRAKLAKGMGHNYYGEPAWPNDLLYIFPVVIFGTIAAVVGLGVLEPTQLVNPQIHLQHQLKFFQNGISFQLLICFAQFQINFWVF